jgi:hypothetical protein
MRSSLLSQSVSSNSAAEQQANLYKECGNDQKRVPEDIEEALQKTQEL